MLVRKQQGFTIVELMIATAVFSTVLLVVTAGIVTFSKQYYKGIVTNATQSATRNTINEVTQAIQFGGGSAVVIGTAADGTEGWCINDKPYYYILGRQMAGANNATKTNHVLVTASSPCTLTPMPELTTLDFNDTALTNPRELLGERMRLDTFSIVPGTDSASVTLRVVYGDDDLICSEKARAGSCNNPTTLLTPTELASSPNDLRCRSTAGGQFCAAAGLKTDVAVRLK